MIRATRNLLKIAAPVAGRVVGASAVKSSPRIFLQATRMMSGATSDASAQLAEALTNEILHETANQEEDEDYEEVKKLIEKSFKITDTPGLGVVTLERKYNDETIIVKFDCQDEVDEADDQGYDRMEEHLKQQAEMEEQGQDNEDDVSGIPNQFGIHFEVTVKKGGSCVHFNCVASSQIIIQNVAYKSDSESQDTALYGGPRYVDLDESVREAFQNYLTERKIDEDFSYYVVNAARVKEEKEYLNWLEKITEFAE
jgi:complement component 1 Q subcomponent-binding protein, mitochondrial